MRLPDQNRTTNSRAAFTLIELVVVIAIIILLVSLTAAAVMKVIGIGNQTAVRSEIGQLEVGLQSAMAQWKVSYLPSSIKLSPTMNYPQANKAGTVDAISLNTLQSMFGPNVGKNYQTQPLNWSGTGSTADVVLEGEEALVFYLGGIPNVSGGLIQMTGFSPNPVDPTVPGVAGSKRIGPFFDFKSNRLYQSANFFVYFDAFYNGNPNYTTDPKASKPYAYFSVGPYGYYNSDCPTLNVQPYYTSTTSNGVTLYVNPRGFQIISAGADLTFGPGGQWNPTTGYTTPPGQPGGLDDLANFSRSKLGTPQE